MKEITFVTSNFGKVENAKLHLGKLGIAVRAQSVPLSEPHENDIEFISAEKARQAQRLLGTPVITQDSGFYISAYPDCPGFPGAFPKRDLLEKMGIEGLLKVMENVADRSCYFKECLSYYDGQRLLQFDAVIPGTLATMPHGAQKPEQLSELWSVFIPDGFNKTISELSPKEYNDWQGGLTTVFEKFAQSVKENNL